MSTQGVGTFAINSFWESGRLIFCEKAYGHTTTGNVFILGHDYVQVGDTGNDVDFKWYGNSASVSFILDAGDSSMTTVGLNVEIDGDITIGTDDLAVAQGYYLYLDGLSGGEYVRSATENYIIVNGTTGVDLGIAGTAEVSLIANSFEPATSNGCSLGTGTDMWSDLFLADGGVINFSNSNVTITHATGALACTGALTLSIATASNSTTTGGLIVTGGVGVGGAIYVGGLIDGVGKVTQTRTNPTAAENGIYALTNSGGATGWTGSVACIRGKQSVTNTGTLIGNSYGGWFGLTFATGMTADRGGLSVGLYAESENQIATRCPNSVAYFQSVISAAGDQSAMPILILTSTGGANATKAGYAFSLGHAAAATTVGTGQGYMYYNNTIKILANGDTRYIPLSTAEGTYTTAYPIATTSTIISTCTTAGISCTASTLNATAGRVGYFNGSIAAANLGDGYGAVEIDIHLTGNQAGHTAALSSWLNIDSGATLAGNVLAAQTNGIWAPDITMNGCQLIFGMRMSAILVDTTGWQALCPFSLNTGNLAITALFHTASGPAIGYVSTSGALTAVPTGCVPLFCDVDGSDVRYVRVYSATT